MAPMSLRTKETVNKVAVLWQKGGRREGLYPSSSKMVLTRSISFGLCERVDSVAHPLASKRALTGSPSSSFKEQVDRAAMC